MKLERTEHYLGSEYKAYDIFHDGILVGHVEQYGGYLDKKSSGSRIVASRKSKKLWNARRTGEDEDTHYGFATRQSAIEAITWNIK